MTCKCEASWLCTLLLSTRCTGALALGAGTRKVEREPFRNLLKYKMLYSIVQDEKEFRYFNNGSLRVRKTSVWKRPWKHMQPITWIYGTSFFSSKSGINGVDWQWKTETVIKGNIGVLPCCHGTISQTFRYPLTCTGKKNHLWLAPSETDLAAGLHW